MFLAVYGMFCFCSQLMPYRPQSFGFKFDVRVEHLTGPDVVIVRCARCEHVYRVAAHHLYGRFPPHMRLADIAARWMRCRRCEAHGKDAMTWHVQRAYSPVDSIE